MHHNPKNWLRTDIQNTDLSKEPLRRRLNDVRDIFYEREVDSDCQSENSAGQRLSMAEGGCLLPPPINVLKQLQRAASKINDFVYQVYPQDVVYTPFANAIEHYFRDDCAIPLDMDQDGIIFGYGSSHIFDGVLSVICDAGDTILMPESYYHAFAEWPAKWGAIAELVPTSAESDYKITANDLEDWLLSPENRGKRAKCLVLTNPTTTGAVYTTDELRALAKVIRKYNLLAFSDEVFRASCFQGVSFTSLASIQDMKDYTITASSGSKTCSVAHFRIGWACGPKAIIDHIIWHFEHSFTQLPLYLQAIGREILHTPQQHLDEAREEYEERVKLIYNAVQHSNLRLNNYFGTRDITYISMPTQPVAGHYVCLNFDPLYGWRDPEGNTLCNSEDLTRHFYHHWHYNTDKQRLENGVCFSSGHSKGHDSLTLYLAFAQPGYEKVQAAMQDWIIGELFRDFVKSNTQNDNISEQDLHDCAEKLGIPLPRDNKPDLSSVYEQERTIFVEVFDRVVCAIQDLTPMEKPDEHHNQPASQCGHHTFTTPDTKLLAKTANS
jgi:aspartate/methionine/tyrosine aminotransferase